MVTIGERIGSYRVVRAIGSGGMGMVFEAEHEHIRSRAAIKILHSQFSENPEVRGRFFTEALATNLVHHPGIVSIFEHGQLESGAAYIIMEYLDGDSLRSRITASNRARSGTAAVQGAGKSAGPQPLDRPAALRLMRQLASAITAAHEKRIVHRDLKPDNIMIVKDAFTLGGERVKVLDFGIAKVLGPDGARNRTGGLLGTPAYMSPESWDGAANVDEKADVYAFGMILFEVLTGQLPFTDAKNNVAEWQELHKSAPPASLRAIDPSVPDSLDGLVQRLLSKQPAARPEMAEVAAELDQLVGLHLRFRAGGFVREGEFYAKRAADESLFYALLNGQSCYVLGPRQIGKTSLMQSVAQRLGNVRGPDLERGVLCATLDLLSVESSGARGERFYFELVRELYRGLGLLGIPTDFWAESVERAPRPAERFALLLRELPSQLSQPAVIFVDHLEVLSRLPLPREEFFAALASAQPTAASDSRDQEKGVGQSAERGQLAFCLLGTATKEELMPEDRRSPFLRSRAIALGDLSPSEARVLLPGLHALGAASDKALTAVLSWTSGHPYLTQRICEALSTKPLPDGSIQHLVESVAAEVISSNRRREDASFAFAEEGVRQAGALRLPLLALYRQILERTSEPASTVALAELELSPESSRALQRLELLGLVRRDSERVRLRNRIFASVFSAEWLRSEEAVRPLQLPLSHWLANQRRREDLLAGPRLREALAWSRGREDLSPEEQLFLSAALEEEQRTQRRRIALLLISVLVLGASLLGAGVAWQKMRLAKQQVEALQLRTEAALGEAELARRQAENATHKTALALTAAREAHRAEEEARLETQGAVHEAARQRGATLTANQRAKLALERAQVAAQEAAQASQVAQEASHRADEANQSVGRAMNEKAAAIASLESRLLTAEKERRQSEATAQRSQQSLESKEAEVQSLRGNLGSVNSQLASLNTQLATATAQLAACRASESARPPTAPPPPPSSVEPATTPSAPPAAEAAAPSPTK